MYLGTGYGVLVLVLVLGFWKRDVLVLVPVLEAKVLVVLASTSQVQYSLSPKVMIIYWLRWEEWQLWWNIPYVKYFIHIVFDRFLYSCVILLDISPVSSKAIDLKCDFPEYSIYLL